MFGENQLIRTKSGGNGDLEEDTSLAALISERNRWLLSWAGVEFIFFIVARMVLSFGFVTQNMLITKGWFSYH